MAKSAEIEIAVLETARKWLGEAAVLVRVREVEDSDGKAALRVDVIVKEFDSNSMGLAEKTTFTLAVLDYLESVRDSRFPLIHVIEEWEWAQPAAE